MGVIDRIKDFFKRKNQKSLPEPEKNITIKRKNDNSWLIGKNDNKQPNNIDLDINRFLTNYYNMVNRS